MTERSRKQITCQHMEFECQADVIRIEDDGTFKVNVRVGCVECGLPFSFPGLPFGLDVARPTVSVDGTELRAPITPGEFTRKDVESRMRQDGGISYQVAGSPEPEDRH